MLPLLTSPQGFCVNGSAFGAGDGDSGVLATLSLSNYSEFGLIVAAIAATAGWLSPEWLVVVSLALAGSFVLASPLNFSMRVRSPRESLRARWGPSSSRSPLGRVTGPPFCQPAARPSLRLHTPRGFR
jgi:hypothetical protein